MTNDPYGVFARLIRAGESALTHDPAIDEFSGLLLLAEDAWRDVMPALSKLVGALARAMESIHQKAGGRPTFQATLGPLVARIEGNNALGAQLRTLLSQEAIEVLRVLATDNPDAPSQVLADLQCELYKRVEVPWNAALVLLIQRFRVASPTTQVGITWAYSTVQDTVQFDGWVDLEPRSAGGSTEASWAYGDWARVLGFGVARLDSTCISQAGPSLLLDKGATYGVDFQVSAENGLVSAPCAIMSLKDQALSRPRGVAWPRQLLKRLMRRGEAEPEQRTTVASPCYLWAPESQAFRFEIKRCAAADANSPSDPSATTTAHLRGDYVMVPMVDHPLGYKRANSEGILLRSGDQLGILVRYRNSEGPNWTSSLGLSVTVN